MYALCVNISAHAVRNRWARLWVRHGFRRYFFYSRQCGNWTTIIHLPTTKIPSMNTEKKKKQWITPSVKVVMIFFECTCYAGAV